MKNLIIGFIVGVIVTLAGTSFLGNKTDISDSMTALPGQKLLDTNTIVKSSSNGIQETVENKLKESSGNEVNEEQLSLAQEPQTIDEYRALVTDLRSAIGQQAKAIEQLDEKLAAVEDDREETSFIELNQERIKSAQENIQQAIESSDPEFAEFLKAASSYSEENGVVTPDYEVLYKHYSQDVEPNWSQRAQIYLTNYIAGYPKENLSIVNLNCRTSYCEIYGFMSSNEPIVDHRPVSGAITDYFRGMQSSSGFGDLFRGMENASLSNSSDNMYMTFHIFIRSKNN